MLIPVSTILPSCENTNSLLHIDDDALGIAKLFILLVVITSLTLKLLSSTLPVLVYTVNLLLRLFIRGISCLFIFVFVKTSSTFKSLSIM